MILGAVEEAISLEGIADLRRYYMVDDVMSVRSPVVLFAYMKSLPPESACKRALVGGLSISEQSTALISDLIIAFASGGSDKSGRTNASVTETLSNMALGHASESEKSTSAIVAAARNRRVKDGDSSNRREPDEVRVP